MWKSGGDGGSGDRDGGSGGEDTVSETESEDLEQPPSQPLESKSGLLDDLHKQLCKKV